MSSLSDVVSVSISADSKTPSREGFGTALIMTYHTRFVESYRAYSSLSEMASDTFASYDDAYRMAAAAFLQDPAPQQVIVGRLPAAPAFVTRLTMTSAVQGQIVKATVIEPTTGVAVPLTYTILAAATTTIVATAFSLLTDAVTGVDSTSSVANVSVTPAVAGRKVHIYDLQNCTIEETTAAAGYDTELTALQLLNDDWYGILIDSTSSANVAPVAAWTLAAKKLFFCSTSSSGELAGTGTLGFDLDALSNDRTVLLHGPNSQEFSAAGWCGIGFASNPGSITWAFKTIKGATAKTLTTTQKNFLEADNINHYQPLAGLNVTLPGKVTSGEYIDIRHGLDALEARIKEDVFGLFANADKVPFTAAGLDMISSYILGAMRAFEGSVDQPGLLVKGTSYTIMPDISTISAGDKAARRLTGVRFGADLEGAIHYVSMVGSLSV